MPAWEYIRLQNDQMGFSLPAVLTTACAIMSRGWSKLGGISNLIECICDYWFRSKLYSRCIRSPHDTLRLEAVCFIAAPLGYASECRRPFGVCLIVHKHVD